MRAWTTVLLAVFVCACSHAPVRLTSPAADSQITESPERFIIAAVDNRSPALLARAGSTPRGYDSITAYGPTSHALRVLRSVESDYGLREVRAWPIEPLHLHCAVLQLPTGKDRAEVLSTLQQDPRLSLAQPLQSFVTRTAGYNDPYVTLQRGFQEMDVAEAHPWSQGEGVKIALIDTGVDTQHPDLARSIAATANFVDSDTQQFRSDRHGTEMAGVIAAIANNHEGIVGVAPGARLWVFKACWQISAGEDAARCNSFTLARALAAALDAHAQVVNLSLAGPADPLLADLIREGLRRGVLFVGAAAPAVTGDKDSLLHLPGVLEVASSESHTALAYAVYAPGREILTSLPGGHYDFASGDSIATAQVTGVVALLLAQKRGISAVTAYALLRDTSVHSHSAQGDEHVDACAAIVSLVGRGTCTQSSTPRPGSSETHKQLTAVH